jgi:hypothetical protein
MSTYPSQYVEAIRQSQATWDRAVEVVTDSAKASLVQAQHTLAGAAEAGPTGDLVAYLNRAFDNQRVVSKKMAAATAGFSEQVLTHSEALATATRDYLGTAQEVLRTQASQQYDQFVKLRQHGEQALRDVAGAR